MTTGRGTGDGVAGGPARHIPVLAPQVVNFLNPRDGGLIVDGTFGAGGYSRAILAAADCRVIGIDRDQTAIARGADLVESAGGRLTLVEDRFSALATIVAAGEVDGVVFDLGVSSMQLDSDGRGFSFRRDEPLDMRMDRSRGDTAASLVARAGEEEIADVIFRFGEERYSRRVARAIVNARAESPIETTGRLAAIVRRAVPLRGRQRIDPATRTFQALRIWVNRELDGLDAFLEAAARRLLANARLAVITFHSLEDRIVKHAFRALAGSGGALRLVTKRPLTPADDEVARNPRARSAKLRAIERLA